MKPSRQSPVAPDSPQSARLRQIVYGLLISVAAAGAIGRLMSVKSPRGGTPMLSANDRSRWATVRALVDHGTYEIDHVQFREPGKRDPEWASIDVVKHRGDDGREHYYSSKPTLFPTLVAGAYWVVKTTTGVTLAGKPFYVIRLLLVVINVLPFIGFLMLLASLVERFGRTDFSRVLVMTVAAVGTYLSTFLVTLNNHSVAAVCFLISVWAIVRIVADCEHRGWLYAVAGISAAMAAASELPALSMLALVAATLGWWSRPRHCVLFLPPVFQWFTVGRPLITIFAPGVFLVGIAAVATNFLAHGIWRPAYAQRSDGSVLATVTTADATLVRAGKLDAQLHRQLESAGLHIDPASTLIERPENRGWVLWDAAQSQRFAVQHLGGSLTIRAWGNWYEYEGSYWSSGKKQGVDLGEPSKLVYAFHALLGHHGVFSLTPMWLFSVGGALRWLRCGNQTQRWFAATTVVLTIVCWVFYIGLRPLEDRNYGGVSCCLRWTLWLVPLWLVCLLPALDVAANRPWLRRLAWVCLLFSVFSAHYNGSNPWSHPWLFDYWSHLGWIRS